MKNVKLIHAIQITVAQIRGNEMDNKIFGDIPMVQQEAEIIQSALVSMESLQCSQLCCFEVGTQARHRKHGKHLL